MFSGSNKLFFRILSIIAFPKGQLYQTKPFYNYIIDNGKKLRLKKYFESSGIDKKLQIVTSLYFYKRQKKIENFQNIKTNSF